MFASIKSLGQVKVSTNKNSSVIKMVNGNYAKVYKMGSQELFGDGIGIIHMLSQTTFINIICCLGFVICIHIVYISQLTLNI